MIFVTSIWTTGLFATTNKHSAQNSSKTNDLNHISTRGLKSIQSNAVEDDITLDTLKYLHYARVPHLTTLRNRLAGWNSKPQEMLEEKTALLERSAGEDFSPDRPQKYVSLFAQVANAITETLQAIISTLIIPGQFLIACFYDENGQFSVSMPVYKLGWGNATSQPKVEASSVSLPAISEDDEEKVEENPRNKLQRRSSRFRRSIAAAESGPNPSAYLQAHRSRGLSDTTEEDSPSRHTRSKTNLNHVTEDVETPVPTRSTRIKIVNQDALRQRKMRRESRDMADQRVDILSEEPPLSVATIKSPTMSMSTPQPEKYIQTTKPPRPLIPRRQPSYTALSQPLSELPQKTLIIDLDETLIHSMAKGGRMSTGHMVEVRLDSPVNAAGGVIGPQVPILYYVHKRPHCDEFLRKVRRNVYLSKLSLRRTNAQIQISKWYNLIVFTASVQEYADPVIDWLELERKYFSARYYRQHCTYRSGAYIKDLSTVEPDLSKVMILDNSPLSYIFHEGSSNQLRSGYYATKLFCIENAIPIEGWISDPTDNDLLNLIPLFEGMQYTTDVRSLLALRLGEAKGR